MAAKVVLPATASALLAQLKEECPFIFARNPNPTLTLVDPVYDVRTGWMTYTVCLDGQACGFTDGDVNPD